MSFARSSLPKDVTRGYWAEVGRVLREIHGLNKTASEKSIANYRRELANDNIGDIIYHTPIEETATGIVVGGYVIKTDSSTRSPKPAVGQRSERRPKPVSTPRNPSSATAQSRKTAGSKSPKRAARKTTKVVD